MPISQPLLTFHRSAAVLLAWLVICLLAGCGGGGGGDAVSPPAPAPAPPSAPSGNLPPVAAFSAPASIAAAGVAALDARTSTDPEGGPLTFRWDFGDGSHGGTAQIAHVYSDAGSYTVRLTVTDAQGASSQISRQVTVNAPAAARQVQVNGRVMNLDGSALAGATVSVQGAAGASATSDAQGRVTLAMAAGADAVLRIARAGFADQVQALRLPATTGADGYFEVRLMPRAAAQTLPDAAVGGSLAGADGARITLPPNALVTAAGAAVTGAVDVTMTPVNINGDALPAFPGRYEGLNADGTRTPIVSYGTVEFTLSQNGAPLQLRPGSRATLELPLYAGANLDGTELVAGGTLPLWSLDERSGQWVNEGNGTLVASAASPTELAMRAEVAHLSWWNADKGYTPYRPRPRCINDVPGQYDSLFEQATICKMLAEMDKPIPAQGASVASDRERPMAAPPRYRFPSVRIETELPIAGGVSLDLPPDWDMVLTGTAFNGTWRGQVRVRGGEGQFGDVPVPLRPLAQGGSTEAITLPYDQFRAAAPARVDRFRFQATANQGVSITASQAQSTLTGTVRLRNAANQILMSAPFASTAGTLLFRLTQAGEYVIEVEPASNAPGGYRLQAAVQDAAVERVASVTLSTTLDPGVAQVAANASGAALAAWPQTVAGALVLQASRYLNAETGWSAPETAATVTGFNTGIGVQLGLDDAGNALAAWDVGAGPVVARRTAAGTWSAAQALASSACGGGLGQKLAVSANGDAMLMWRRATTPGLCWRRFAATTGTWSAEQVIDTPVLGNTFALEAAADGTAAAAWTLEGPASSAAGVAASRFANGASSWSTPSTLAGSGSYSPTLAIADDGSVLAAWHNLSNFVDASHWPAGGSVWSGAQRVGTNNGSFFLSRAVWRLGSRFQVVWLATDGLSSREFDGANGQWSAPLAVAPGRAASPIQSRGGAGGVVVMWWANKLSGTGTDIGFSRWNAATGNWVMSNAVLTPRPQILNQAASFPDSASLAVSSNGSATMLWREFLAPGVPGSVLQAARVGVIP